MGVSGAKYSKYGMGMGELLDKKLTRENKLMRLRNYQNVVPTHSYGVNQQKSNSPSRRVRFSEEAIEEYHQLKFENNEFSEAKMAEDALVRHFGVPRRQSTARVVLRVRPIETAQLLSDTDEEDYYDAEARAREREQEKSWVLIDYNFNRLNGEEILNVHGGGGLDSLLPENAQGLIGQGLFSKDSTVNIFFNYLDHFINNMEGVVWWNGFTMKLMGDPTTRLELTDMEMDPLRLTFNVKPFREIDVIRSRTRFELIGKPMKSEEETRKFKIRGWNVCMIQMMAPKDGIVVLNFPPYDTNKLDGDEED